MAFMVQNPKGTSLPTTSEAFDIIDHSLLLKTLLLRPFPRMPGFPILSAHSCPVFLLGLGFSYYLSVLECLQLLSWSFSHCIFFPQIASSIFMILNIMDADNSQSQVTCYTPGYTQTSLLHSNPTSKCLLDSSFTHLSGIPNLSCPKRNIQASPPNFVFYHLSKAHQSPLQWIVGNIRVSLNPFHSLLRTNITKSSQSYLRILSQMHLFPQTTTIVSSLLSAGSVRARTQT